MKIHFLGIGGSGASAAAALAQSQGFEVTGCDLEPNNEFTTGFNSSQLHTGHDPKHLENMDILAVTPAIFSLDANNPELREARKLGIEIMTWQQFVGEYLTKNKFVIAVCGTHGKTTTTAMIAKMLEDANLDPTVEVGAIVPSWKTNFRIGKGRYFVIEADEFNDNFLHLKPDITVVTNIEMDHPEYFKDFEAVKESFKKFLLQTKGTIVANLLDSGVVEVLKVVMKETSTPAIDYSKNHMDIKLQIPGDFNKLNSMAALQVGLLLGINTEVIKNSLQNYKGVGRRFEYIGEYSGSKVYSDFGHHPTEIKVTAQAAREKFPDRRILLIYQPHMFSRTKALFNDFVKVFKKLPADKIFIMDIYPSREIDMGLVTSKQLVDAIGKNNVSYIGLTNQVLDKLKPEIKKGDIIFFMSAGDTDRLAKELVSKTNPKYCTIYIIRHGETNENLNHIIQGQSDSVLNETGKLQAKNISQRLKKIKFENVFSSDLSRTKETAEIIALERKIKVEITKALRERRWGRLEGKSTKLIYEIEKLKNKLSKEDRFKYKPFPDTESDEEIASRTFIYLREIAVAYSGKTILIVSHGGVMRILLNHLGKNAPHGATSNTAYIELESDGVEFFIKKTKGIKFNE